MACTTPAADTAHIASVVITLDGATITLPFDFTFSASPVVYDILPRSGPQAGGTSVTVAGQLFAPSIPIFCRFDTVISPARMLDAITLLCISPQSLREGSVAFAIHQGLHGQATESHFFEYVPGARILTLTPSQGPSEGQTRLIIEGQHFSRRAAEYGILMAKFNTTVVGITEYVSGGALVCLSPQHLPGAVTIEVSNNLQQYTSDGAIYTFVQVALLSISPVSGPVRGGTTTSVRVSVSRVSRGSYHYCKFGNAPSVPASSHGEGLLTCVTPAFTAGPTPLSLIAGTSIYQSTISFIFKNEVHVETCYPAMGPQVMCIPHFTRYLAESVTSPDRLFCLTGWGYHCQHNRNRVPCTRCRLVSFCVQSSRLQRVNPAACSCSRSYEHKLAP